MRQLIFIASIVLAVSLVIGVFAAVIIFFTGKKQNPPPVAPIISPMEATPTPFIPLPTSPFATNAGILKLESDLNDLLRRVDTVDLVEPEITPPNLDLHLNIPPQT